MYGQFHVAKTQIGAKLLRLNKNKDWLVSELIYIIKPDKPDPEAARTQPVSTSLVLRSFFLALAL
ncbi:hypothetical protein LFU01_25010 [Lysinibacillus fusiformis]|nr:hypothetical protein LFU01_25010 [Lysinibacillus fusiformis]